MYRHFAQFSAIIAAFCITQKLKNVKVCVCRFAPHALQMLKIIRTSANKC